MEAVSGWGEGGSLKLRIWKDAVGISLGKTAESEF